MPSKNSFQKTSILWIEPSHFDLDNSLHKMADLEVGKQLVKRNVSIYMMVMGSINQFSFSYKNSKMFTFSIPIKRYPLISALLYAFAQLFYLPYYLLALSPSVILIAPDVSVLTILPILFISKVKGTRLIMDIRTVPVELRGFKGFLQEFWFSVSIIIAKRFFDAMTTITPLMKADLIKKYRIDKMKFGVWTSGVSVDLFEREKNLEKGNGLKAKQELSNKFIVFYHGVFSSTRGLIETIKAFVEVRRQEPNIVLFLLGSGPAENLLKELVQKESLQESIIIHPPVRYEEVPPYVSMADVCILPLPDNPYWRSQSPLKLLEYLAMEKTVILTDIPAHKMVIGEKPCGIFINSVSPHAIAEKILEAFKNKEKLSTWGRTGKIIIEEYTWAKVAQQLDDFIQSV